MRKYIWIILGIIVVGFYLFWINREMFGFAKGGAPKNFTRNDLYQGNVLGYRIYELIDGKYYYTLSYGIAANLPQEITESAYNRAFKS